MLSSNLKIFAPAWNLPPSRSTNLEVAARHTLDYGESARPYWWNVTELTLEHLRGWTELEKALAEVQGEFWKGGDPPSPGLRRTGQDGSGK
jgi:hypothetical protein